MSLTIACLTELKTIAIMKREFRIERKAPMSYMNFMNNLAITSSKQTTAVKKQTTAVKKQTKVRVTSYKKELADFLKHTASKKFKFDEVFKSKWTIDENGRRGLARHERLEQSRKNWKKYCVKLYEADFKKECMLEVNGKFFRKPTTIPETETEIMALCDEFHERIEKAHGQKVPYNAGLYKVTIRRFTQLKHEALIATQWRIDYKTYNDLTK